MLDPGSIIALTTVAYHSATIAWEKFRDTLHYSSDSEDLILQLELERFRFQTWARNAGLTEGTLSSGLLPIYETVERQLHSIGGLFQDADQLRDRYGLSASQSKELEVDKVKQFVAKMRKSIRASGIKLDTSDTEELGKNEEQGEEATQVSSWKRIQWGVRDRSRFQELISSLESHIQKLNQLLTETQQRSAREDWKRINIVVVGSVQDKGSLQLIRDAVQLEPESSSIRALIERKAIADDGPLNSRSGAAALNKLNLTDFVLAPGYRSQNRIMARSRASSEGYFLLEKKGYDPDISMQDKQILTARIHRLVLLLSVPKSADFRTLHAIGFIHDPDSFCWWLVFRFPAADSLRISLSAATIQPVSLLTLFESKFRPPLEQRLRLASMLTAAFSELYGSSWLHKGIRSNNILFPQICSSEETTSLDSFCDISSPLVSGFTYSRQETEAQTIDKGKFQEDIIPLIYRHPNYQGEVAQGYRIQYDIYSFGLVLVEIAWWVPLVSFLDSGASRSTGASTPTPVYLSSKMKRFHRIEALELRRRVVARSDRELAFRAGSAYFAAVKWCLSFGDQPGDQGDEWHPALEFYNRVVVPLRKLANIDTA
ncbi:MAG: hypothetical protein M1813_007502 [Trichoglossum hirsutum]|nr:MAG: hypothetical protein M1813_007502 [Trichoglossum hirsutum]